jgi:hypothetical protein
MGLIYLYGEEDHKVTKITDRVKTLDLRIDNKLYAIVITVENIQDSEDIAKVYLQAINKVSKDYEKKEANVNDIFEKLAFYIGGIFRKKNKTLLSLRAYELEEAKK